MRETELKNYLNKCVRCGQCRSVCPVFEVRSDEGTAPRGKVFIAMLLLTNGQVRRSEAAGYLSLCLQCRRCTRECPSGVPVHLLVSKARKAAYKGRHYILYDQLLARRRSLLALTAAARLAGQYGLGKIAAGLGILPSWVEKIAPREKAPALPEYTPALVPARGTLAYFPGCAALVLPGPGQAAIKLLSRLGWNVVVPRNLTCCGFPHSTVGSDSENRLREANLRLLKETHADAVVTTCPSCALALSSPEDSLSLPVQEISEFLAAAAPRELFAGRQPRRLVYHRPCHLPSPAPKQLLAQIPGTEIINWPEEDTCCGGGGTFMIEKPSLSSQILASKVQAILNSGAGEVIAACPSCTLQLKHGLGQTGIKVRHPAEILLSALRGKPKKNS